MEESNTELTAEKLKNAAAAVKKRPSRSRAAQKKTAHVKKLQAEFLSGPADESLAEAERHLKANDVVTVKEVPKAEWVIFRNQRDPGYPLDFHYSSKSVPFKMYNLIDGDKYLLPVEVIQNLERCREEVHKYRRDAKGNPQIYVAGFKSHFVCERVAV